MALWGGRQLLAAVVEDDTSGARAVLTVASDKRVRVFRFSFTPDADIAGDVSYLVGATQIHRVSTPKAGSEYGFDIIPHYYLGALGEDVTINFPTGGNAQINLAYELQGA